MGVGVPGAAPWLQAQYHRHVQGGVSTVAVVLQSQHQRHSELQFFKMGIAICVIEMRGSTIREAKNRSFELITPFKTFRYPACPGGTRLGEQPGTGHRCWKLQAPEFQLCWCS